MPFRPVTKLKFMNCELFISGMFCVALDCGGPWVTETVDSGTQTRGTPAHRNSAEVSRVASQHIREVEELDLTLFKQDLLPEAHGQFGSRRGKAQADGQSE